MVRAKESRKMILRPVGFFRELPHGSKEGPSLMESMQDMPAEHEGDVVEYLRQGALFIGSPGPVRDIVDDSGPIGTASVYTDGTWAWFGDLPHYILHYHVALPREFLDHAESHGWRVDSIPLEQLRRLMLP
jgi:hypothetical protein